MNTESEGYCITSSTRSISVRISWMVCPAEMSVMAGDMNELRKPWNTMMLPRLNLPSMVSSTPSTRTVEVATVLRMAGMAPRYWFSLA